MLTKLTVRNFKLFRQVEIELGQRVVFIGPNNAGKTSALQALALWNAGVLRWVEKRGEGNVPRERAGVTLNRRDLITLPVPSANLLWRDLHVREGYKEDGKQKTRNILIQVDVDGVDQAKAWSSRLEFDYANEESFYCRSRVGPDGNRFEVPSAAAGVRLAYLPPMSGLASTETRLDEGAIGVRIGEGRTAEVLRNLCWLTLERDDVVWKRIVKRMHKLFGVTLEDPTYIKERGEIRMTYKTDAGVELDLSASGRGQQQTLLLLAHMAANPGSVLLLDEPDAHLEILRQRQIYGILTETAAETNSQIIAASHSEVILNEAADRDMVVAFVGRPHRIDDRVSHVRKALKEIGFEHYAQAEEVGWVLYLEGSTDRAVLNAFAQTLGHAAAALLERPFVHYVENQPKKAQAHYHGLREAKEDLVGLAVYDRLDSLPPDPYLKQHAWRRREIENYLCQRTALLAWAEAEGRAQAGDLFALSWRTTMEDSIKQIADALQALGKPDPWGSELKASDEFLGPLFEDFFKRLGLPNLMTKTNYHTLAPHVPAEDLDAEVREVLDMIVDVSSRARPR
ncbi:MAG TPA: AAA family ATPase [Candidatus Acidoferrales bacterium]|nr:AAA family ATPase [Candidatus Acidoferrales bacterium]